LIVIKVRAFIFTICVMPGTISLLPAEQLSAS